MLLLLPPGCETDFEKGRVMGEVAGSLAVGILGNVALDEIVCPTGAVSAELNVSSIECEMEG